MMSEQRIRREILICEDKEAISRDAAYRFVALSHQAKKHFTVALAGGSTPAALYRLLASSPFRESIAWEKVHLFFGDERCVPPDSPDSNFRMTQETLLGSIPLPPENLHRMPGESTDLAEAARDYEKELSAVFQTAPGEVPRFDLILLGMGPDGHCASLFPHKTALTESKRLVVPTEPGLKPFVPRLTLTFPVLNHAAHILFLVAGSDKAETLAKVLSGLAMPQELPSQSIAPTDGTLTWLIDREAAKQL